MQGSGSQTIDGSIRWDTICRLNFVDGSLQLAASGVDVSAPRPAQKGGNTARDESLLKGRHLLWRGHRVANPGTGIPGDQIHLHRHGCTARQRDQLVCMLQAVVHTAQQYVLEGDAFPRPQRQLASRLDDFIDLPLAGDGHDRFANRIVGGIQADRQPGPHRLTGQTQNAGHNAGSGNRHPGFSQPCFVYQQTHRRHELVIIQERFAHAHEDQVDPVAPQLHCLPLQHRDHLAGDFSGRQVSLQSQSLPSGRTGN